MLRILCCAVFLAAGVISAVAQENIDPRLVKNRGKQAEESFKYNKNGYNYFLFELDKSHWIAETITLSTEEKAELQSAAVFKNAEGQPLTLEIAQSPVFNFYDFGIRLQKDRRIYIALDETHVLVFYRIPELTKLFASSEFNTK